MEGIVLLVFTYNGGTKNYRTSQNMRPTAAYNVTRLYQRFHGQRELNKLKKVS